MKCKHCGSGRVIKRGVGSTRRGLNHKMSCRDCNGWMVVDVGADEPSVPAIKTVVLTPSAPPPDPLEIRQRDREIAKLRDKVKEKEALLKDAESKIEAAAVRGEILSALRAPMDGKPFVVKPISKGNEATAVVVLSDTHIEERVDRDKVNGLNEYNPEIARARIERVMQGALIMVKQQQREIEINTIVLAVLGDIITGYIHEDLVETNYLSPIQACILAREILTNCIELLVENTKCNIIVVCTQGNHGRTTEKRRIQSYAENSFEYLLYRTLEAHYANHKRVTFRISEAYHNYLDVYGYIVRFHHGDFMSYGGGVGGITIPVNKSIAQWNQAVRADLDVFGHWHQLTFAKNFISNGSTIGFNQYALSIKAGFEPPQQAFFLIDKKRKRYTLSCPLFTE